MMRDYAELIEALRYCATADGCLKCHRKNFLDNCSLIAITDAADAIEELLVAVPHWISVGERMPDSGERVLIMFKPFEDDENISIGWLTKSGFDCYDDSVYFFRSVTHWMPLPEPPKGETE